MTSHTPGPWKTGFIMNGDRWVGPEYDQPKVCRIEDERDEFHANARLVAAAPDLLEACRLLLSSAHDHQTGIAEAEAAIAKATGGNNE